MPKKKQPEDYIRDHIRFRESFSSHGGISSNSYKRNGKIYTYLEMSADIEKHLKQTVKKIELFYINQMTEATKQACDALDGLLTGKRN